MSIVCEFEFNGQEEIYEFNKVAKMANGSVLLKKDNAVLLATVVSEFNSNEEQDIDFIPLTVQYIEKTYAVGKLPSGFIKREAKPSEFETLTSRIIDRSLRPLFPKNYHYNTTITIIVLSAHEDTDLQVLALNAASAALYTSDLPIYKMVSGIRLAKIDNKYIINPKITDMLNSTLDLYIAGSKDELLMIEMKSISSEDLKEVDLEAFANIHNTNEIEPKELVKVISIGQDFLKETNQTFELSFKELQKDKFEFNNIKINDNNLLISNYIKDNYILEIKKIITKLAKSERNIELEELIKLIHKDTFCVNNNIDIKNIYTEVINLKKDIVRKMIINDNIRADGRDLTTVRPISIDINILPSAHSSCLFTRGQTQALVVSTLSDIKNGQVYELLTSKKSLNENLMVHYNFPGFCVGEAKPMFGVGRRELGHGNLAKKALESSIKKDLSNSIRLVSEILESNGSSSMATICGASIALKAAGIDISNLVAGVAMGLIVEDDKYAILTDIIGLEDHDGDMDFKVAGTKNGITALQMDIKLGGISLNILEEALIQASKAKNEILDIMEESSKNIIPSNALPLIEQFKVDSNKIMLIIGKAGSTIKSIIEKFDVNIDLDRSNSIVKISGNNKQNILNASEHIKSITKSSSDNNIDFTSIYKENDILIGKVERILDFGAFINLPKGGEGLLHISKISKTRINKVEDVLNIGDTIELKVLKVSKDRIELASSSL